MQIFYTVQSGDTLYALARRWQLPLDSLIAANNLRLPYLIFPGQQLSVPPGVSSRIPPGTETYRVQPGDTLFRIAARYNVVTDGVNRYDLIMQANNLTTDLLFPGMLLRIPYAPPGGPGLLAYFVNRAGEYDLWLYNPRNGTSRMLSQGLGAASSVPYWSSNSQLVAFVGLAGIIYVIDINSGEVIQIDQLDEGAFLAWSSNSNVLVYIKGETIYLYNVTTSQFQTLLRPGASQAQLFPDGMNLLYVRNDNQLIMERFVGVGMETILYQQDSPMHEVRLNRAGTFVVFTYPGVSISLIRTVEVNTRQFFDIPGGALAKNYFPTWSRDSSRLAYSTTAYQISYFSQVRTVGARGANARIWAVSNCFATPVSWSPDSSKLAYLSGCSGAELASQIWVIDLRHPVPVLAVDNGLFTSLAWSPS